MVKKLLKGIVIGIANVLPGISAGAIAVSMGLYDKIIYAVTHVFSDFKNSMKTLLPIILGAIISIVGLSFAIEFLFEYYPLQTNLLFVGLIIGGLPMILDNVKDSRLSFGNVLAFLLFFAMVISFAVVGSPDGRTVILSTDAATMIKLVFIGVIAAATMVVPGVSGTMILMLLGYYQPIIENINAFIKALASFDINSIVAGLGILTPFGIGVVVGMFAIAKGVEFIFDRFPIIAYFSITGLIMASPIAIMLVADLSTVTAVSILTGIVAFAVGILMTRKLG